MRALSNRLNNLFHDEPIINRDEYGAPRCFLSLDRWGRTWSVNQGVMIICTGSTPEAAIAGAAEFGSVPDPEIFWDGRRGTWNDLEVAA